MRRLITVMLALFVVVPPLAYAPVAAQTDEEGQVPETAYPVVFEIGADEIPTMKANEIMRALDIPREQFTERIAYIYEHAITGFALRLTPYEVERAERIFREDDGYGILSLHTDEVRFSVPDMPTAFEVAGQMSDALKGTEVVPAGVQRTGAPLDDASNVDVAVIDTGSDRYNADLNVVGGTTCVGDDPDEWGEDGHGHGTHVAGTIGAEANGRGVVGVAPGARIWSVQVLDASGSGTFASVICGIDYVAGMADVIEVANMSLGGTNVYGETSCGGPDAMHNAICGATDLGVVFTVAAGNSTDDAANHSPAAYDEVITVSAFTDFDGMPGGFSLAPNAGCTAMSIDDTRAAFSNYGDVVDIAAPGVCVLSTYLNGQYAYASGTSMAAPHVAGCVSAYLQVNPDQRHHVERQLLNWSKSRSDVGVTGAWQGNDEPLLNCSAVPRYEAD